MRRILVLGQIPPPFHGQTIMTKTLLEGSYKNVKLKHLNMRFSRTINEIGSYKIRKFWVLFKTIVLAIVYRIYYRTDTLYYGPTGPNKRGMIRDLVLLFCIRWVFKYTIFHTHAGGGSSLYKNLSTISKYFYRKAFFYPTAIIRLTEFDHGDAEILMAKKKFIVPNGISDEYRNQNKIENKNKKQQILYVGALYKERGILTLIKACSELKKRELSFELNLVGLFTDNGFEKEVQRLINKLNLNSYINFHGALIGTKKYQIYMDADIFCFPSQVPSETFGIVLIEAMQFKIPVIATNWNGIPFIVNDNENGFLFPINDSVALADKLEILIKDTELRQRMGNNGRKTYLGKYSISKFYNNMNHVFNNY